MNGNILISLICLYLAIGCLFAVFKISHSDNEISKLGIRNLLAFLFLVMIAWPVFLIKLINK
jgi:hypothetical protein